MPPRQQNKHLPRGLGTVTPRETPPRAAYLLVYLLVLSSSVIRRSAVVMTRLAAVNPVEATIRLMNSLDRSTLLSSRAFSRTLPMPSVVGAPMIGSPLLDPAL